MTSPSRIQETEEQREEQGEKARMVLVPREAAATSDCAGTRSLVSIKVSFLGLNAWSMASTRGMRLNHNGVAGERASEQFQTSKARAMR